MTNPSTIATPAAENEQPAQGWQVPQAEADTVAPTLRAMATNYPDGHLWDKLDARACIRGAREIERLRAAQAPQINAEDGNVWPIVNIDVDAAGNVTAAKLYAPGLPAGNHDVYPVRVPYMDEHTEAWLTVVKALREVAPDSMAGPGNGIECAVAAIHRLAAQAPSTPSAALSDEPRLDAPAQVGNVRFSKGIRHSLVIQVAQRHHAYMNTPEREAERIALGNVLMAQLRAKIGLADKLPSMLAPAPAAQAQDAARFVALLGAMLAFLNGGSMTAEQRRIQEAFEAQGESPLTLQSVRDRIDAALRGSTEEPA